MTASRDARILLATRAIRGFADGTVSVLLASHLTGMGFSALEVGAIVTGTLLGSAALTLAVGLAGHRFSRKRLLLGSAALMFATGLGFAGITSFWPLLVVAVAGTLNPSAGDVSVFLPMEQAALADSAPGSRRTSLFAWYNLGGTLAGAIGALASALPALLARQRGWPLGGSERLGFVAYAGAAIAIAVLYRELSPAVNQETEPRRDGAAGRRPALARSRATVIHLAALFSLDSFGGGFVVQSLLVLWLYRRFGISIATAGTIFFCAGALGAFSQLVSSKLAARIGLVRTMVYTHLPSNLFLIIAGLAPRLELAVGFLLLRSALSQMDVPARQSYVMSVVHPEERAAAASVTNVPRSLAAALPPVLVGLMLDRSTVGWPLICAGALKAIYDVLLLAQFRHRDRPS